jgi:hypothetical protein
MFVLADNVRLGEEISKKENIRISIGSLFIDNQLENCFLLISKNIVLLKMDSKNKSRALRKESYVKFFNS